MAPCIVAFAPGEYLLDEDDNAQETAQQIGTPLPELTKWHI